MKGKKGFKMQRLLLVGASKYREQEGLFKYAHTRARTHSKSIKQTHKEKRTQVMNKDFSVNLKHTRYLLSALGANAFFLSVSVLFLAVFWSSFTSLTHLRTQRDIMCISVQLHALLQFHFSSQFHSFCLVKGFFISSYLVQVGNHQTHM